MKLLALTEEGLKALQTLSHHALKGVGLEALSAVKSIETWLSSAIDSPASTTTSPGIPVAPQVPSAPPESK